MFLKVLSPTFGCLGAMAVLAAVSGAGWSEAETAFVWGVFVGSLALAIVEG